MYGYGKVMKYFGFVVSSGASISKGFSLSHEDLIFFSMSKRELRRVVFLSGLIVVMKKRRVFRVKLGKSNWWNCISQSDYFVEVHVGW